MSAPDSFGGEEATLTLADGTLAHIVADNGGFSLQIDGTRQSHIGPADAPPRLAVTRWMLAALADLAPSSMAHLGGGLLSLPRYLAHYLPHSRQLVIESEQALIDANLRFFPPPTGIRLQCADALEWVELTTEHFDAITVDIFAGGRIPPEFTTTDFYRSLAWHLSDLGRVVINSVAGPELDFTRGQLASMREVFEHVAMLVQGSALAGARFGNAVLIGSQLPIDTEIIRGQIKGDASRVALVTDTAAIAADAKPVATEKACWSPVPNLPNLRALQESLRPLQAMSRELKSSLNAAKDAAQRQTEEAEEAANEKGGPDPSR